MSTKDICLTITYICNWDCEYCVVDTHNQKEPVFENIIHTIKNDIPNNSHVSLTGGEPGIVKKEKMDIIITELLKKDCEISVNTNGEFIKNYSEYYSLITSYLYHCSDKLDNNIVIYDDPEKKISYSIVVDDNNFKNLNDFLNRHKDLYIIINAAYNLNNGMTSLSNKNVLLLIKEFKDYINPRDLKRLYNSSDLIHEVDKF